MQVRIALFAWSSAYASDFQGAVACARPVNNRQPRAPGVPDFAKILARQDSGIQQLSALFSRYRRTLARAVARIVRPQDVEDIVQETYVRIYRAAQRQQIHHPKSFMLRTARNLALNHVGSADDRIKKMPVTG